MLIACSDMGRNGGADTSAVGEVNSGIVVWSKQNNGTLTSLLQNYLVRVESDFGAVDQSLASLQDTINSLLDSPSAGTLAAARDGWTTANRRYESTSIHRHFAAAILPDDLAREFFQAQYRVNHLPIRSDSPDYLAAHPVSGIVHDLTVSLTPASLRQRHQAMPVDEVVIGFQALQFLLWGNYPEPAGARSFTEFIPQRQPAEQRLEYREDVSLRFNNRRRQFLRTVTTLLREDFHTLMGLWSEGSSGYQKRLRVAPGAELLLGVLDGMTSLLTEDLLVRSLYPILDDNPDQSPSSPSGNSSWHGVSAQLASLETLLLKTQSEDGITLDSLLAQILSVDAEHFRLHLDEGRECLKLVYGGELFTRSDVAAEARLRVAECTRQITDMTDLLEQTKLYLLQVVSPVELPGS